MVENAGDNIPDEGDDYMQRKARGACTRSGCPLPALEDSLLCERHRAEQRARVRKALAKLRRKRRKSGKCRECGRPAERGYSRCLRCRTRRRRHGGRGPKRPVETRVENNRSKVAERTAVDVDGRSRYHGQERRGQPAGAQLDEWDLDKALRGLLAGRDSLRKIEEALASGTSKSELKAAKHEALALLNLGIGFAEEVLERGGYFKELDLVGVTRRR